MRAINIIVANARSAGGGIAVAPTANPEDGLLDVVTVHAGTTLELAGVAARLLAGDYTNSDIVTHDRARRCEIASAPRMSFNLDGELVTIWPDRYRAWAGASGLRSPAERRAEARLAQATAPASSAGARRTSGDPRAASGLHIAHPAEGTVFLIDPTLRAEFQAVPFRAGGVGGGEVTWTVDGRELGSRSADESMPWPLQRGSHVTVVRDSHGRTAEVSFTVK